MSAATLRQLIRAGNLTRCAFGMRGCVPPSPEQRLAAYVVSLAQVTDFDPHAHARRAAAGLARIAQLRKHWARIDRKKRRTHKARRTPPKRAAVPTNVVALRPPRAA